MRARSAQGVHEVVQCRAADKLKFTAGSEAAMGAFVGDVAPEAAAEALRAVLDGRDATTGAR